MAAREGTLFWDLDGTLIDSMPLKGELFARVFDDFPDSHDAIVEFHLRHGGMNRAEKIQRISQELLGLHLSDTELDDRVAAFGSAIEASLRDAPLAPGAAAAVSDLSVHYRMHVVTAMPQSEASQVLHHHGMAAYFDSISGFPLRKADAVRKLLRRGTEGGSASLIGDSREDALAAEETSIRFIQVRLNAAGALPSASLVLDGLVDAASAIRQVMAGS